MFRVLNFGTFHMGFTPDANTTKFDEHDRENQQKVHEITEKLSDFEPTIIIVETPPEYDENLHEAYHSYKENPPFTQTHSMILLRHLSFQTQFYTQIRLLLYQN